MDIRWYGHASFGLTPQKGPRVITDPYTPELVGYTAIPDPADMVIMSSADDDGHCREDLVPGEHEVLNALDVVAAGGTQTVAGLTVSAMGAMEWEHHPYHDVPGQNAMYRFEMDGMQIAHMGDVGNRLTKEQLDFYDDVDVLLALTGAALTIKLPDLMEMIHIKKPKIVIPMHYRTLTYKGRRGAWVADFLAHFHDENVDYAFGYDAKITKSEIPSDTRVLVMDYYR